MSALEFRAADAFADRAHAGQYRSGISEVPKIPYIKHPRDVVSILRDEASIDDLETLISAVLHDTIEDANVARQQLVEMFGVAVADVVCELTNDENITPETKKASQVAHARAMSERACAIKIADKTANLRDILSAPPAWSIKKKIQYFEDAREVIDAMAYKHPVLIEIFEKVYAERPDRRDKSQVGRS